MGFFSDLKEDISQAVNELITEELPAEEKEISLEKMLQNIDDIKLPEEIVTEEDSENEQTTEEAKDEVAPEEETIPDLEQQLMAAFGEKQEEIEAIAVEEETANTERCIMMNDGLEMANETSVVSANMKISGDILSEGSLNILGYVKGGVEVLERLSISGIIEGDSVASEICTEQARIQGNVTSRGSVKIGVGSVIIGNVVATSAVIAGAVKGDIDVHGPVILDSTAIVMGNIKSEAVQINSGAIIEGMCSQCYANVNPTAFFEELDIQ